MSISNEVDGNCIETTTTRLSSCSRRDTLAFASVRPYGGEPPIIVHLQEKTRWNVAAFSIKFHPKSSVQNNENNATLARTLITPPTHDSLHRFHICPI